MLEPLKLIEPIEPIEPIEHGGRLNAAAARYGIALSDWLDLSTGINPNGWPVPALPARAWNRLPEPDDELIPAAQAYYRAPHILPVAGSQAAIQILPTLRTRSRVGVIAPGYNEHAHAWRRACHDVTPLAHEQIAAAVDALDVVVLIQPNNPTGLTFSRAQLLQWHTRLAAKNGWLIVDEAFMDTTPENSIAEYCTRPGLIVLRSLGKFFGLAGARVGFVCAAPELLQRIDAQLGPWMVCGPARHVATCALNDIAWQEMTRVNLQRDAQRLHQQLTQHHLTPNGGCSLFQWVVTPHALQIHERLAHLGVLTRLFQARQPKDSPLPPGEGQGVRGYQVLSPALTPSPQPSPGGRGRNNSSLRFGLPANEAQWQHLESALVRLRNTL